MDVDAVADQLGDDVLRLEHGTRQTRGAMRRRSHAIEEMGCLTGTGADALERLLVCCTRVAQRHVMPVCGQIPD